MLQTFYAFLRHIANVYKIATNKIQSRKNTTRNTWRNKHKRLLQGCTKLTKILHTRKRPARISSSIEKQSRCRAAWLMGRPHTKLTSFMRYTVKPLARGPHCIHLGRVSTQMTQHWYYSRTGCDGTGMCCERRWWLGEEMYGVWSSETKRKTKRTWKEVVKEDCQACKLNIEDAMDGSKLRKLKKDVRWSGWVWVGECFLWYQPTRVDPNKRPLNGCVCV